MNLTDRKQTAFGLHQSEAHFRTLIEHSSDIITVLSLDGIILFESPSFERLLGYNQHELDGRIAFEFLHPDDLPTVVDKFQLVVERPGETQTAEFRFHHKDGSWLSLEGIGRSILDTEGQRCVIVNSRDITERKRAEEALRKAQEELEDRVEERTLDLRKAKEELEAQRNKLEEMNIALRVLLERREEEKAEVEEIIHFNIKQLITPYLEKLEKTPLDDRQATIVEILISNLGEVISPFSRRLSSSQLSLTPREIKVAALIKQGHTSKEMADLMDVSLRTIEAHRVNIRKKIGIKNKKGNLRTQLLSME